MCKHKISGHFHFKTSISIEMCIFSHKKRKQKESTNMKIPKIKISVFYPFLTFPSRNETSDKARNVIVTQIKSN